MNYDEYIRRILKSQLVLYIIRKHHLENWISNKVPTVNIYTNRFKCPHFTFHFSVENFVLMLLIITITYPVFSNPEV